jgi:type VI secretion system FHA domain protein
MEVRLRVTHCNGLSRPREVPLTVNEAGIDIGRALISDLCLEDPERVVSGLHARIHTHQGRIWLTDLSRNGTHLNDAPDPVPAHRPVALHDGDRLGIGSYEVLVSFGASSVSSLAWPRQVPVDASLCQEATPPYQSDAPTHVLSQLDPGHGAADESRTDVWSLPNLSADDPFAATAVLDATLAGVTSAMTQVHEPLVDEITHAIPSFSGLDDRPTQIMPASLEAGYPAPPSHNDEDVQAPDMAMDSGIQAALSTLLARFDPAALERQFVGDTGLNQGLSLEDKATCWDGFSTVYEQLVAEASADFMQRFDEAITRAYCEHRARSR